MHKSHYLTVLQDLGHIHCILLDADAVGPQRFIFLAQADQQGSR